MTFQLRSEVIDAITGWLWICGHDHRLPFAIMSSSYVVVFNIYGYKPVVKKLLNFIHVYVEEEDLRQSL
jgi:hypothetical protein